MDRVDRGSFAFLVVAVVGVAGIALAERVVVPMQPSVDIREAAVSLRSAVDAFEQAELGPLPQRWTRATVARGRALNLGSGQFLLLQEPEGETPKLMFIDNQGPHAATVAPGQEIVLGSLRVILASRTPDNREAEVLYRAADSGPMLLPPDTKRPSSLSVTVRPEHNDLVIECPSQRTLEFAVAFLDAVNTGKRPEEAAKTARAAVEPDRPANYRESADDRAPRAQSEAKSLEESPRGRPSPDRTPTESAESLPTSAAVEFVVVHGDRGTLGALGSEIEYRGDKPSRQSPPVSATSDGTGTTVEVGRHGDQFHAKLKALESTRRLDVQTRLFLRVPLDGQGAGLTVDGPGGVAEAWVTARPQGKEAVTLRIEQRGGDWSFLGAVSTRVSVRKGQTLLLAQNTVERRQTTKNGIPVLGGIPYVGPLFGRETKVVESNSYSLFATVNLE